MMDFKNEFITKSLAHPLDSPVTTSLTIVTVRQLGNLDFNSSSVVSGGIRPANILNGTGLPPSPTPVQSNNKTNFTRYTANKD